MSPGLVCMRGSMYNPEFLGNQFCGDSSRYCFAATLGGVPSTYQFSARSDSSRPIESANVCGLSIRYLINVLFCLGRTGQLTRH
jgi:hypothetical protein